MISAVTANGALRFSIITGTLTAAGFTDFCTRLLHDAPGPVFLILDGHPVHRSTAVTAFAASTDGRLRLFRIPAYFPQLGPDEWVWKKHQARPRHPRRGHWPGPVQGPRGQGTAPAPADAAHRARVLRRPPPGVHHRHRASRPTNDVLGLL